jgi:hypothetical protein
MPQVVPVVDPVLQALVLTGTRLAPVMSRKAPRSSTPPRGSRAVGLLTRMAPKSLPGKLDAATGPIVWPLEVVQVPPRLAQCPAVRT